MFIFLNKRIFFSILILIVISILSFNVSAQDSIKLRAQLPINENMTTAEAFKFMVQLVEERTEGKVDIEVFWQSQLAGGRDTTVVEQTQNGVVDIMSVSTLICTAWDPKLNVLGLPFIFESQKESTELLKMTSISNLLGEGLESIGFKVIGWLPRGFRQITNSKREIAKPEDLAGLKIRTPEADLIVSIFKSLNATPTPIDSSEIYNALQMKVVDGQETPLTALVNNRWYETQKYLTLWNYSTDAFVIAFNKDKWGSLPPEIQNEFIKAAKEAADYNYELDMKEKGKLLAELEAAGLEITTLDSKQFEAFRNATASVYEKYENVIGLDLIEAVQNGLESIRK